MLASPLIVLMYHHIGEPPAQAKLRNMYVTQRQFELQLRWLKKQSIEVTNFERISAADSEQGPPKVVLTFDDGYLDNYRLAFPLLKRFGFTAVVFPILDDIGRHGVTWDEASEKFPATMMSESDIREMSQQGIEFGSHLTTHRHLSRMTASEQSDELSRSKTGLEAILQKPVRSIAYPYGDYTPEVLTLTRQAGYHYGVTTEAGNNPSNSSLLTLKRYTAKGSKLHHPLKFRRTMKQAIGACNNG